MTSRSSPSPGASSPVLPGSPPVIVGDSFNTNRTNAKEVVYGAINTGGLGANVVAGVQGIMQMVEVWAPAVGKVVPGLEIAVAVSQLARGVLYTGSGCGDTLWGAGQELSNAKKTGNPEIIRRAWFGVANQSLYTITGPAIALNGLANPAVGDVLHVSGAMSWEGIQGVTLAKAAPFVYAAVLIIRGSVLIARANAFLKETDATEEEFIKQFNLHTSPSMNLDRFISWAEKRFNITRPNNLVTPNDKIDFIEKIYKEQIFAKRYEQKLQKTIGKLMLLAGLIIAAAAVLVVSSLIPWWVPVALGVIASIVFTGMEGKFFQYDVSCYKQRKCNKAYEELQQTDDYKAFSLKQRLNGLRWLQQTSRHAERTPPIDGDTRSPRNKRAYTQDGGPSLRGVGAPRLPADSDPFANDPRPWDAARDEEQGLPEISAADTTSSDSDKNENEIEDKKPKKDIFGRDPEIWDPDHSIDVESDVDVDDDVDSTANTPITGTPKAATASLKAADSTDSSSGDEA